MWGLPPLLVIVIVWLCMGGPAWKMRVPVAFSGDALFYLAQSKSTVEHGWWWFNPSLSAPSGLHALPFAQNTNVDQAIVWIVGLFTSEIGLAVNLAWLAMLALSAVTATWGLRRLGASRLAAGVGGVLFACSPFAFYRSIIHFNLVTYLVPFPATAAVLLAASDRDRPWTWRDLIVPVLGCMLAGFNYVYFAFFGGFALAIGMVAGAVRTRTLGPIKAGSLCLGALVLATAFNFVPNVIAWRAHGQPVGVEHSAMESEVYGLKIRHLISPTLDHWFPPFQRWLSRENIARFPTDSENIKSRLGIAGTVGFLGLLGLLVFRRAPVDDARARRLHATAVVTAALLLLSMVGGFGALFSALVSSEIRAYNRVSAVISFLALVGLGLWLDRLMRERPEWLRVLTFTGVLALGVADQLPALRELARDGPVVEQGFEETLQFWAPIEAKVPAHAMVYQMPTRPYPLDSGIGRMGVYAHFRPYLSTHGLRWSYPPLTEPQRNWEAEIARVELVNLPRHLAGLGFSLISINRGAYADDGQHLRDELTKGGATFVAESWEYLVMDLRPVGGPK